MVKFCHNHLQYERVSMLFFYFEYCQFWLKYTSALLPLEQHHKIEKKIEKIVLTMF
jgi:hypothetical protein